MLSGASTSSWSASSSYVLFDLDVSLYDYTGYRVIERLIAVSLNGDAETVHNARSGLDRDIGHGV